MILPELIPHESGIYIVGGTVRDFLMGKQPTDYDIAVQPPCEALAHQIAKNAGSRVICLGKPGLVTYRIVAGGLTFDVAPLAGETIHHDLKRRDFTINAMAWDVEQRKLIDILNGRQDIEAQKIRMIAGDNFRSDPLRLLRAFRMGAAFEFTIDFHTLAEIRKHAHRIWEAAGERIRDELMKMLERPHSGVYLQKMDEVGLLAELFPELAPLKNCRQNEHHDFDAFEHTLTAYDRLEKIFRRPAIEFQETPELLQTIVSDPARLKLALLLHDIGKPACRTEDETGNTHFYRHAHIGADMARRISQRLKLPNKHQTYLDFIIRNHLKPLHLFIAHQSGTLTKKAIARFILNTRPLAADLLVHAIADARGKQNFHSPQAFALFCRQLIRAHISDFRQSSKRPPLVNGHDLINEFNLAPSPVFADLLARVEEERLSGNLKTRAEALAWIKNFIIRNNLT